MLILSGDVKHHNAFRESSPYTICGGCLSCAEGGGMVWCLIPQKKTQGFTRIFFPGGRSISTH